MINVLMLLNVYHQSWTQVSWPNCHFGIFPSHLKLILLQIISLLKCVSPHLSQWHHHCWSFRSQTWEFWVHCVPHSPSPIHQLLLLLPNPSCIHFSASAGHHSSPWSLFTYPVSTSFLTCLQSFLPAVVRGSLLKCKVNLVFSA